MPFVDTAAVAAEFALNDRFGSTYDSDLTPELAAFVASIPDALAESRRNGNETWILGDIAILTTGHLERLVDKVDGLSKVVAQLAHEVDRLARESAR